MILLKDIYYRYPNTDWVLNGIDLSIEQGEYVVVCGPSGSGKSTLAYLFNGLIPHFFGGTLKGSVTLNDVNTGDRSVGDLFQDVGLVLQNADAHLFNSTVENEIAFGLESLGIPGPEIQERVLEIARLLDIEDLFDRTPTMLSGGEMRLVSIASILCLDPSIVLLDEPFANLDWAGAERVGKVLRHIHKKGKTVMVVQQQMGAFLRDSSRCLIVKQGKISFDGGPQAAFEVLAGEHLVPQYAEKKRRESHGNEPILAAHDLSCRIEGKEILKDITFELNSGETVALIGRNGAGKTTLVKHLNGLLQPAEGEVIFLGKGINGRAPSEISAQVGLSFQNPNDQFFKSRVEDELNVGPKMLGKPNDGWIKELCSLFDLDRLLDRSPYRLSEGEKKRVAISSILTMRPKLLVLDEPTIGQDGCFKETLARLLAALGERGFTTLIVTHDLGFAQAIADRWMVLHEGKLVAQGSPHDLLQDDHLIRLGALGEPDDRKMAAFLESREEKRFAAIRP